jgi:hypothetical protein
LKAGRFIFAAVRATRYKSGRCPSLFGTHGVEIAMLRSDELIQNGVDRAL